MAAQLSRRGFVGALLAGSVLAALPRPALAQAVPVSNAAGTAERYLSASWQNYVRRVGSSLTASQMATVTAAANDNLAAAATRTGARTGVAMLGAFASANPVVAGLVVGAIVLGVAGYVAYKYFAPTSDSGNKTSTVTYEQALASSNWSLYGKTGWSLWKQSSVAGVGWEAYWLWTPPSGRTQADFNHKTDLLPLQPQKSSAADLKRALDTADQTLPVQVPWLQDALQRLAVDTAQKAAAAGTPLPVPFADPASVPLVVPADFPTPTTDVPMPGPGALTQPVPGADGTTATPPRVIATPSPATDPGGSPTPSPSPTASPDPSAVKIDWGTPPDPEAIPSVTPTSWFPTLFTPPNLPSQCTPFSLNVPGVLAQPLPLDPCPSLATLSPIVRPAFALSATIVAGKILLDT